MERLRKFFLMTTPFVMVSAVLMLIYGDLEKPLVLYFWGAVIVYFFIGKSLFSEDNENYKYEVKDNKNNNEDEDTYKAFQRRDDEMFENNPGIGIAEAQIGLLTKDSAPYYNMFDN